MTDRPISVLIVEDDASVRLSLSVLLETWGYHVTAFGDVAGFRAYGDVGCIDVMLLDIRLPDGDGIELVSALRGEGIATPIVVLTGHGDVVQAVRALKAGAQEFFEKPFEAETLTATIQRLAAEKRRAEVEGEHRADVFDALSPREHEVMLHVVAGHPNKIIAHSLDLSPKTIELHRARVMEKTGARNLSHLVRLALKAGIDPDDGQI
ncbi:MAG: response regulator [Pseudomonadota bacterium]